MEKMRKFKTGLLMAVSIPAILLAGCLPGEKAPIEPDNEPAETVTIEKKAETKSLNISDVIGFYEEDNELAKYTEKLKGLGYDKPYKEILLAEGEEQTKKGLIYEVQDGFAMLEYDVDTETVLAITGYQKEQEFILQEMKTKAYAKENEVTLEKDPEKKAMLQQEADAMWLEIGKLEA